jgi:hypothetical protein
MNTGLFSVIESITPIPEKANEWVYVGKKKDGTPKLRRPTNESVDYVADVLNERKIAFEYKPGAKMFRIYNPNNYKQYQYFYTTGQWGQYYYGKRPDKHYHSNGINEFLDKYMFKVKDTNE